MGVRIILFVVLVVSLLLDFIIIKRLKTNSKKMLICVYLIFASVFNLSMLTAICFSFANVMGNGLFVFIWLLLGFISLFFSKIIYVVFALIGWIFSKIAYIKLLKNYFRILGVIVSILVFCVLWWGALVTARTPKIETVNIYSNRLPESFDDMKLVHISDFHLGSFGQKSKFPKRVVDVINQLNPDIVLFTGDLVNSRADELLKYEKELSGIKAKYGVFSVLGNHDYGDYYKWNTMNEKEANLRLLKNMQKSCGWNLLNNDHISIVNGNDSILLIGVENWGDYPFPKYGKLQYAYPEFKDEHFKILLSHNPVHWKAEVLDISNIDLMLSGHTHAMQFILSFANIIWSPAKWRYNEWGGLYEQNDQYLYVNRGLGYIGMPVRVGASPEVTLLILKRK